MQSVLKETIIYKAGETDMIRFLLAKGYENPNESDQKTTPNNDLVTPPPGGGTPIHYLYGYVPPNGIVILKLLI